MHFLENNCLTVLLQHPVYSRLRALSTTPTLLFVPIRKSVYVNSNKTISRQVFRPMLYSLLSFFNFYVTLTLIISPTETFFSSPKKSKLWCSRLKCIFKYTKMFLLRHKNFEFIFFKSYTINSTLNFVRVKHTMCKNVLCKY